MRTLGLVGAMGWESTANFARSPPAIETCREVAESQQPHLANWPGRPHD
jgi:aspartate/glutamate racemase